MNNQPLACPPGLPHAPSGAGIADYLREVLKLGPGQLINIAVDMRARLGAAIQTAEASYNVPSDSDLAIISMHSYFRSTAPSTEPALNAAFTSFSPSEMQIARLANCTVDLQNKDRNLKLTDNGAITLGSIAPPSGFPLVWPVQMPFIMPRGQTFKATFTLLSVVAAVAGNDADYGIILTGVRIPTRL